MKYVLLLIMLLPLNVLAKDRLADYTIKLIEPVDGHAVIKSPAGKIQLYKVGDKLAGSNAKIVEILVSKLVLEDSVKTKSGAKQIQKVLMSLNEEGEAEVRRIYLTNEVDIKSIPQSKQTVDPNLKLLKIKKE